MFEYKTSVTTPYCDNKYYLAAKYCPYLVQEISGRREAEYKCDIPHLRQRGKDSWVLLSTSFEYYQKPYWMRDVTLTLEAFAKNHLMVPRRIRCYDDATSTSLFRCDCTFAVVTTQAEGVHKIIDPQPILSRSPSDELKEGDFVASRYKKFNIVELAKDKGREIKTTKHRVLFTDCDINGHMNNLKYVNWIVSSLPPEYFKEGLDVKKMDICYTKELHLGDEVEINYVDMGDGEFYASISDSCCAHLYLANIPRLGGPC